MRRNRERFLEGAENRQNEVGRRVMGISYPNSEEIAFTKVYFTQYWAT